jgi:endonuclease/exonuclease/phosphatase (EEP) superfamily protein YafD
MTYIARLIRLALVLGALGSATLALLALFGFAVPELDLLNHAQILLLPAIAVGIVLVALLTRGKLRDAVLIYCFMGLAASAQVVIPEAFGGLQQRPVAAGATIRMMTHNLFGLNYRMDQVSRAIFSEDPDIIVFQEYFGEQASGLHPLLTQRYPYFVRCQGGKRANLGLYSRLPFDVAEDGQCPDNAYVTDRTAHILARFMSEDGKPFTVLTSHMDWPFPVARQHAQLAQLADVVSDIDGPLVLAGDFNSTPWSYTLRDFVADTGLVRETMNLLTYPMRWFYLRAWRDTLPFLPLDHVMTRGLTVHKLHAGEPTASDHLPVVFEFTVD